MSDVWNVMNLFASDAVAWGSKRPWQVLCVKKWLMGGTWEERWQEKRREEEKVLWHTATTGSSRKKRVAASCNYGNRRNKPITNRDRKCVRNVALRTASTSPWLLTARAHPHSGLPTLPTPRRSSTSSRRQRGGSPAFALSCVTEIKPFSFRLQFMTFIRLQLRVTL